MHHLPLPHQAEPGSDLELAYREIKERFGLEQVPSILRCFGARPDVLWAFTPFADSLLLGRGHLTRRTREMLATYVSAVNRCEHCTTSHSSFLRAAGGDPGPVVALASGDEGAAVPPNERELLHFARKVTLYHQQVAAADIADVRSAGWNDDQVAEAVLIAAYFNFTNRLAGAFGLRAADAFTEPPDRAQKATA